MTTDSFPVVSHRQDIQDSYVAMRKQGESHNISKMCALQVGPALVTDATFRNGNWNGKQFVGCPRRGEWYRRAAESEGISTTGRTYMPSLADFPGDPSAWISGRGDIARVCREKNFNCDGTVKYKAPETEPEADIDIDPELVAAEVADICDSDPGLRREDVEERVRQVRTGAIDLNPLRVTDPVHDF